MDQDPYYFLRQVTKIVTNSEIRYKETRITREHDIPSLREVTKFLTEFLTGKTGRISLDDFHQDFKVTLASFVRELSHP